MQQQLYVMAATIVGVAVVVQLLADATNLPSIVLLLAAGLMLGPNAIGLIQPSLLQGGLSPLIALAVALIVFEGAFTLDARQLRSQGRSLRALTTVGLLLTFLLATLAAKVATPLSWSLSLQFGALVSVTGPTVIMPLIKRVPLTEHVRTVLAGEAVLIDPLGALLILVVFDIISQQQTSALGAAYWVAEHVAVGIVVGLVAGLLFVLALRLVPLVSAQVTRLAVLMLAMGIYAGSETLLPNSGLVAVVIAGLILGNTPLPHKEQVRAFKGDLVTIAIALVYLLLAARVNPHDLLELGWRGVGVVLFLIFIARPLVVASCTFGARSRLRLQERVFIGAVAPRGVVAASLATLLSLRLLQAGVATAQVSILVNLVFLTISLTIAIQGTWARPLARLLGVMPMRIIVVGGGRTGRALVERLLLGYAAVTLIEQDPTTCQEAMQLNCPVVLGDATELGVLRKAGVEEAEALVATTGSDKDNLMVAQIAKTRYGVERVMARVNDPALVETFTKLGIAAMSPSLSTATVLEQVLLRPNMFELLADHPGLASSSGQQRQGGRSNKEVREVRVGRSQLLGKELKEARLAGDCRILLLRRDGQLVAPTGSTQLLDGDIVTLTGSAGDLRDTAALLGA